MSALDTDRTVPVFSRMIPRPALSGLSNLHAPPKTSKHWFLRSTFQDVPTTALRTRARVEPVIASAERFSADLAILREPLMGHDLYFNTRGWWNDAPVTPNGKKWTGAAGAEITKKF